MPASCGASRTCAAAGSRQSCTWHWTGCHTFPGLDAQALRGRLLVAPNADYIERAYNHAKYNEYSQAPMLEVTLPTLADPTLAPAGKHVASVVVQYAPYELKQGWAAGRQPFTDIVIDALGAYAPDLRSCVLASEFADPGGHRA